MRKLLIVLSILWLSTVVLAAPISYQGQLQDGSGPYDGTADMEFRLYDSLTGGSMVGASVSKSNVPVSDGLFQVELDFGDVYDQPLWLEVEVGGHVLSPRQPITAAPMAVHALNVPEGSDTLAELDCSGGEIAKWDGDEWVCAADEDTTYSAGDGLTLSGTTLSLDTDHVDGLYWRRGGNEGTDPANDFIGTIDAAGFAIHVGGQLGFRLEHSQVPNVIGGGEGNKVGEGPGEVIGATIGGGGCAVSSDGQCEGIGFEDSYNQVTGDFGTIGGGLHNRAGIESTVGGGNINTASGPRATVAGGGLNIASGLNAAIGGGEGNEASGLDATVPGGSGNRAIGDYSLAAGRRARAIDHGTFVWADSTFAEFASTGGDQFLVRAGGGVGINTNDPQDALHVDGVVRTTGGLRLPDGSLLENLDGLGNSWQLGGNAGTDPNEDFIGTTDETPFEIHVEGERALRLEPGDSPNIIAGWSGNIVDTDVMGATIGGGGCSGVGVYPCDAEWPNQVTANYGTIGGGIGNTVSGVFAGTVGGTVGGGWLNTASGLAATIGGGKWNTASGGSTTIAGGKFNNASGHIATIGGGEENTASGSFSVVGGGIGNIASWGLATVGGGDGNIASGMGSTVPGGINNRALGPLSFAAGEAAKAEHLGTFVWADTTDLEYFASTDENQFLIRAAGGVGINTNDPNGFDLAVDGDAAKPGGGSWSSFSDARLKQNIQPVSEVSGSLLERLLQLNAYKFEYTDEAVETRLGLPGKQIGLLAQEVKDVFPEWVDTDEEGYLYVTERGTTAIMVEALRELRESHDRQMSELRKQVAVNSQLAERNAELEERLVRLEAVLLDGSQLAEN